MHTVQRGCSSVVEHNLAKVGVEGSNPFTRSNFQDQRSGDQVSSCCFQTINSVLVTIIIPIFAIILDALMLDQFVTASELLGFALVAAGLLIMDGRLNNYFIKKN